MNARLAEKCRKKSLDLIASEHLVFAYNTDKPNCLKCQNDIFLGFFFDGTNNNKYRDTSVFGHSNIARLYEAFSGSPTVPVLELSKGQQPAKDEPPAWTKGIAEGDKSFYRKTYIPGVGTPFANVGDSGEGNLDQTLGNGASRHGEVRICWALLQVSNHIHAALLKDQTLADPLKRDGQLAQQMVSFSSTVSRQVPTATRLEFLRERGRLLQEKIAVNLGKKPEMRRVRISIFGFSRGAAEARVFANWLLEAYGSGIAGIALSIDFMGLFDTVASVGAANVAPIIGMDGHFSWASAVNLKISSQVKRCVHLVAAHEVRGSFPLDAIGSQQNVKEVVYPGSHSDVGGGYRPNEQGRSIGLGAKGDEKKLSQIPLAQMYREARMSGVPMLLPSEFNSEAREYNFTIAAQTIADFNAYIQATQKPLVPVNSEKINGSTLWPVEQQAPTPVRQLIHEHYAIYLQWRAAKLDSMHLLPGFKQSLADPAHKVQDQIDIKITNEYLKKELSSLMNYVPFVSELTIWPPKMADWNNGISAAWHGKAITATFPLLETLVHDSRANFQIIRGTMEDWKKSGQAEAVEAHVKGLQKELNQLQLLYHMDRGYGGKVAAENMNKEKEKISIEMKKKQENIDAFKNGKTTLWPADGYEYAGLWGYLRWRGIYGV